MTPLLPNMYWDAILVIDRTGLVENFLRYVRKRVEESGLSLGVAEYCRDYVEIAERSGAISGETAEKPPELIPARHTLIHRYRDIDYAKLWRDAQIATEAASRLLEEVRRYLKKLGQTSK